MSHICRHGITSSAVQPSGTTSSERTSTASAAGPDERAQRVPARRRRVGQRAEHPDIGSVPGRAVTHLGYRLLRSVLRMPHRIVEHVHAADPDTGEVRFRGELR